MYIRYVCPPGALLLHAAEGVVRFDIETQLPLPEAFFGVVMPHEDRELFLDFYRRGLREDYGIVEDGKIVGRCAASLHARGKDAMGVTIDANAPMRAVFEALGFYRNRNRGARFALMRGGIP